MEQSIEPENKIQKEPSPFATGKEWFLLGALIVWGYLFVRWSPVPYLGISLTLFTLSGAAISLWYLRMAGKKPSRASYLYLGALFLLSLSFGLFQNSVIRAPLFLLLPPLFTCWLVHAANAHPLDGMDVRDSISLWTLKPFTQVREKAAVFSVKEKSRKQAAYIGLGVALTIPVFAIAMALLMEADTVFSDLMNTFANLFSADIGTILMQLSLGCLIAIYLFSLLLSAVQGKRKSGATPLPQANATVLSIMIGALCVLYSLFVAVQAMSVLGVFQQQPQSAFSYSKYARDGFFELCAVTVLNLAVFSAAQIFRKEKSKALRILLSALGGLTLALIVTAIGRMALYMSHHGLTLLRVQTMWFMVSLFLAFGMLIALQWKNFNGFRSIAVLATVSVLLASYANIGGLVAKVNVDRYLAGNLNPMDMGQYYDFPYEAMPEMLRLYQTTENETVQREAEEFFRYYSVHSDPNPMHKSVQRMTAEARLKEFCENNQPKFIKDWYEPYR